MENETLAALGFEQELFLVGLLGFTVFYGLERWARRARTQAIEHTIHRNVHSRTPPRVFWVHIGSFTVYNLLIGYLLFHREETGFVNLVLYFIAMALHLVVNDVGLRELHERAYDHIGKWLVATGVIVGGVIGALSAVPSILVSLLLAFIAGGVILNVIKEELPDERQSRFWAFAVGAGLYTALMIVV
ncbi:hypothetical protein ACFQH3_13205 [Haladaptatus sp. GCM10025707]|uniref:hypothetical protein n=1 Tax=unclassified Haladaptatus TaxID=2622732 RepID=UPI0023E7CDAF|nr:MULTISPECIES: hypothetical protein [unclassified Haladaptatus]